MATPDDIHSPTPSDREESQVRLAASLTLGGVMAGHVLLETACDALFLANVSVERLPLVTIAVALLALGISRTQATSEHRRTLLALQSAAAVGTLAFFFLIRVSGDWAYYVLYVWSGVITSVIVVRFWLLLGEYFTIIQAKRLFAAIAMGGSLGALFGSGAAAGLAPQVGGEGLLIGSALAYGVSAFGPGMLLQPVSRSAPSATGLERGDASGLGASLHGVLDSPYACRVALIVVFAGMTLTLGDYLFKSVLTEEVAAADLATILARIYLGLNVLSIGMLAIGVTPLVQRLGVDRSLVVLPALIGLAGLGVLAGGALGATVFLKAADGTLRYSLHKTASELLYLPMSSRLRAQVKGAIDIVGQAGAKSLASLLILALVMTAEPRVAVAVAVVLAAGTWIGLALRLRGAYLDVFRATLQEGTIQTEIEHPELDLDSAESLIRALSEPDERRVLASMKILMERGYVQLIPSLILYHPSPSVVSYALDLFAETRREDLLGLLEHLVDHEDANVRAASVRASWVLSPDLERLRTLGESECLAVRVSAVAGLLALGESGPDEYRGMLQETIEYETYEPRLAAATAARLHYHPSSRETLIRMASDESSEVAREAVRAIRGSDDAWFTAPLVGLLGDRRIREEVRAALLDRGQAALAMLAVQLVDASTPVEVLRHIPRTIARFESTEAAEVLIESLPRVARGMVRFKVLRGLEWLLLRRRQGGGGRTSLVSGVDTSTLRQELARTLDRCLGLLELEAALVVGQQAQAERSTSGGELLVELLADKRALAIQRLFMMLGLIYPEEDFRVIQEGLSSPDRKEQASAAELVETLLPLDVGRAILALAREGPAVDRLAEADPTRKQALADYETTVGSLLRDDSPPLRALALYHVGELDLECELAAVESEQARDGLAAEGTLQDRALSLLRDLSGGRSRVVRPAVGALLAR